MATKRNVRVRISHQRVEALLEICEEMLQSFKPVNDHHFLLREYMRELQFKLTLMIKRIQENYTLSLTTTESVAFYQLWNMLDIRHDKYAAVIVETMLKKMGSLAA
ncbi:hypothetical protein [Flavipsychrobacter stenotrophus]|nr:hypothetical protein [Flavipsychrobacter stenotrophus]